MSGWLASSPVDAGDARLEAEMREFFAGCPTSFAQQTPGWCRVIEAQGVDAPRHLLCRRDGELVGVLPAWRFEGPLGAILTSCAQAGPLGGVACAPGADRSAVYASLLRAFLACAGAEGCAVATLITNPFWPDRELCERFLEPDFVLENACQVLDLETGLDADGWPVEASSNLRRNLKRAFAGGLVVDEEQSPENVAAWHAVHVARQREIDVPPLPERLFTAALELAVPAGAARFFFVRRPHSGEMLGGGLYLHHGSVMDALMPSVSSAREAQGASFLLGLHSMRWARAHGVKHYNWQPSPPGGGVHRFKRQWGSRDVGYAYLTRITGDVAPILASSVQAVKEGYPFHYVVPFDRIGAGAQARGVSTRSRAWNAAEPS